MTILPCVLSNGTLGFPNPSSEKGPGVRSERASQPSGRCNRTRVRTSISRCPRRTEYRDTPGRRGHLRNRRLVQYRCAYLSRLRLRRRSPGRRRHVRRPHADAIDLPGPCGEHLSTVTLAANCSSRVNSSWRSSLAPFALLVMVPTLWLLYLLVILLEVANCIAHPAFMVELRTEAPEEQRSAANGVLFASMTTAQLVGPVLGALVLAPFGAGAVFALNGLTFFGVAVAVAKLGGGQIRARRSRTCWMTPIRRLAGS